MPLAGLANYVGVKQPVHNLWRRALSRRLEGMLSMLIGHSFRTASQSSFPFQEVGGKGDVLILHFPPQSPPALLFSSI